MYLKAQMVQIVSQKDKKNSTAVVRYYICQHYLKISKLMRRISWLQSVLLYYDDLHIIFFLRTACFLLMEMNGV
jgi:hypothetical protein